MHALITGRRAKVAGIGVAVLAGAFAAIAAVTPIDFTGHWTGTATPKSGSTITLVADLTSSGRSVTGTLVSTQDGQPTSCMVKGRQKGKTKLHASLTPCKTVFNGTFDSTTDTITGHYVHHGRHHTDKGTFMITRGAASPSGAFLD